MCKFLTGLLKTQVRLRETEIYKSGMLISGTLTETAVERADALRRAPASDEAEAAMAETEVAAARAAICTCLFVRRIEVMQGSKCRIGGNGKLGRVSATVRAQSGRGGNLCAGKSDG